LAPWSALIQAFPTGLEPGFPGWIPVRLQAEIYLTVRTAAAMPDRSRAAAFHADGASGCVAFGASHLISQLNAREGIGWCRIYGTDVLGYPGEQRRSDGDAQQLTITWLFSQR
jgi:hypothetical protein